LCRVFRLAVLVLVLAPMYLGVSKRFSGEWRQASELPDVLT